MAGGFFWRVVYKIVIRLVFDILVKPMVEPIERRIRYLYRFHKLIEDLHQQQKNLNGEQTQVVEDVKEAKLQRGYVDEWLTNGENALKDVRNLDGRIAENKKWFHLCPNWHWRYQLGKEIEKKAVDISKLVKGSRFEGIGHPPELPSLEFFTSKDIVASKSSIAAFNKIMEALKDEKADDGVISGVRA